MLKTAENGNLKFDRIKVHVSHLISPSASHRHTYLLIYWYNIDSYVFTTCYIQLKFKYIVLLNIEMVKMRITIP